MINLQLNDRVRGLRRPRIGDEGRVTAVWPAPAELVSRINGGAEVSGWQCTVLWDDRSASSVLPVEVVERTDGAAIDADATTLTASVEDAQTRTERLLVARGDVEGGVRDEAGVPVLEGDRIEYRDRRGEPHTATVVSVGRKNVHVQRPGRKQRSWVRPEMRIRILEGKEE